jgi:ABC-type cobalamin/Fe3+-siderophores transport system ATPase subunit
MNLTLQHVTGGYGSRTVVDDVSFTLHPGEVVCLLGANGCGKTTLFKMILRLLRPRHGSVLTGWRGDCRLVPAAAGAHVGLCASDAHSPIRL